MPSLQQIIDANPEAETFRFGDSKALCDRILALVRAGTKTATCEAARHYGPASVLARTWSTGFAALWIVVLLGICLILYYL